MIASSRASDDVGTTKRRELSFENFDEVLIECRHLADVGYHRVGKWNLGQICQHLAACMNQSIDGYKDPIPFWLPIVRPVVRMLYLPTILKGGAVSIRAKAPPSTLPSTNADDEIRMAELEQAMARVMQDDVEFVESPVVGQLTKEEWRKLHLWHCQHHLSFLIPGAKR
ncbi:DUF1569 domain-containing protein [Blastopirellula sp. JC732]|uniref:DUF1569 domain-containing protein n=1 Tax=Blastopirellula sediminis TaxID=2894196 RepID=A0A9X1MRX4_9BACT|nr:DUF1569 domain-containing protein [Blastopirellula sediminis]MCC9605333.1 DUF1569 domain-containing protein [Blastopirellula sediminis]MCC9631367.1 DUF1569 domain-containing protein [Blastopirellula sediminis]